MNRYSSAPSVLAQGSTFFVLYCFLKESKDGANNHNHPNMAPSNRGHESAARRSLAHPTSNNFLHQPSDVCNRETNEERKEYREPERGRMSEELS
jgi:hypothetical protein